MGPHESDVMCWCGRPAVEWVSFTEKNPGRRFVRCANRVRGCRFWEWVDEPVSPLVRSVMSENLKKAEGRITVLSLILVFLFAIVVFLVFGRDCAEDFTCNCNCALSEFSNSSD